MRMAIRRIYSFQSHEHENNGGAYSMNGRMFESLVDNVMEAPLDTDEDQRPHFSVGKREEEVLSDNRRDHDHLSA